MDIVEIAEELEALHQTGTRVPGFRRKVLVDIDRLSEVSSEFPLVLGKPMRCSSRKRALLIRPT